MTTLYDKIFDEVAEGINKAELLRYLDHVRANELKQIVSDWLDEKEREDEDIKAEAMTKLFSWGDEADQAEALERAGVVFSSEKMTRLVL